MNGVIRKRLRRIAESKHADVRVVDGKARGAGLHIQGGRRSRHRDGHAEDKRTGLAGRVVNMRSGRAGHIRTVERGGKGQRLRRRAARVKRRDGVEGDLIHALGIDRHVRAAGRMRNGGPGGGQRIREGDGRIRRRRSP